MVNAYGIQAVADAALGKNPGTAAQIATQLAGGGAMLAHGRSEETEADEYGARYSTIARYDPHGLITFFQKLQAKEGNTPGVLKWLSTHPTSADRIQHLEQYIAQHGLSGTELGADRLAPIKQKLGGR
jgi:predicted Zn-dependent protease